MNDLMISAKRILKNKNTVTIGGVIIILVLLYFGYSTQINNAVKPIQVPVASRNIQPRTLINDEMVTMIDMPAISVSSNVITSKMMIVGKYSNVNSLIPEGSMFYKETVIDAKELPDAAFVELKKGEIAFSLPVNMNSTYGNSIMPGNKIDIYMKYGNATAEEGDKVTIGKLINNIKVLAVKDASGKAVFENTETERTPSMMIFGVKEKIWLLLSRAQYLKDIGVELIPVPHSAVVSKEGATEVTTKELEDYINTHAMEYLSNETNEDTVDVLRPTFSGTYDKIPATVKISFPEGCGSEYACNYVKDGGKSVNVKKKSMSVSFSKTGTLVANVTEKDGTKHTAELNIPYVETTNDTTNVQGAGQTSTTETGTTN